MSYLCKIILVHESLAADEATEMIRLLIKMPMKRVPVRIIDITQGTEPVVR